MHQTQQDRVDQAFTNLQELRSMVRQSVDDPYDPRNHYLAYAAPLATISAPPFPANRPRDPDMIVVEVAEVLQDLLQHIEIQEVEIQELEAAYDEVTSGDD